jgi:hypothetical protein
MAVTTGTPGADTPSAADSLGGQAGNELHFLGDRNAVRLVDGFNIFQTGKSFIAVDADINATVER